jgi:hypothetical protein
MPVEESPLAKLEPGFRSETFVVSPDGWRVAMAAAPPPSPAVMHPWDKLEDVLPRAMAGQGGECCWVDGQPGLRHETIGRPVFSADSKRVAYIASDAGQSYVVVDGVPHDRYASIIAESLAFSADSAHVAYLANVDAATCAVVLNGKELERAAGIESLTLSPHGGRYGYFVRVDDGWIATIDNNRGPLLDEFGLIEFSADGRHVAYGARINGMAHVVADVVIGPPFSGIGVHRYNCDGTRLAYAAQVGDQQAVIVNGVQQAIWPRVADVTVTFSPDGRRLAYMASDGELTFMVIDGQRGESFHGMLPPIFSADSRRVAYIAGRNDTMLVVVDDKLGPEFAGIGSDTFRFSADGEHFCYDADLGGQRCAVRDHECGPAYESVGTATPILSADGKRMAYTASRDSRWFVVDVREDVDGREDSERYDGVVAGSLQFSPDGRTVAFAAGNGPDQYIVVDGRQFGPYTGLVGPITFEADQSLHALVLRDHDVLRVRVTR